LSTSVRKGPQSEDLPPIIFAGSASRHLGNRISELVGVPLGNIEVRRFSDGEMRIKINENVRGAKCFVVQSTCTAVNENLMELLLTIDALKRASAGEVNAVIPYFGYARQDRKDEGRVALSAKLVANLITTSGADRVITMDLHAAQIQGFFDIPVDHLYAAPTLVDYILTRHVTDYVVVSPDVGNVKRARGYARRLDSPLAIIDKRRPEPNVSEVMNIIGDVEDRNVFIFDDMIDTAGTLCGAAYALKERGARDIFACCTHPVFSGPAIERLSAAPIKELIVTDSIPHPESTLHDKLKVVSVAPLLSETIARVYSNRSVSEMF
jgi:ribose-phosphate pyrophosphokinase